MPRMAQGPLDTSLTPKRLTLPRRHAVRGPATFLGARRRQSTGLSPSRGAPPLTQSPRLANQVQPPPVRARFRALGENPRLPWPVNHFNAFLKPERINPPPRGPSTAGLEDLLALWVEGQRRERWLLPLWVQRECRLPPRKSPFYTRPSGCPNHEKTPYPSRNKQFSRLINCYKIYKNGGRGRSNRETAQTLGSRRPGGARGRLGDGLGNGHVPPSPSQL